MSKREKVRQHFVKGHICAIGYAVESKSCACCGHEEKGWDISFCNFETNRITQEVICKACMNILTGGRRRMS